MNIKYNFQSKEIESSLTSVFKKIDEEISFLLEKKLEVADYPKIKSVDFLISRRDPKVERYTIKIHGIFLQKNFKDFIKEVESDDIYSIFRSLSNDFITYTYKLIHKN